MALVVSAMNQNDCLKLGNGIVRNTNTFYLSPMVALVQLTVRTCSANAASNTNNTDTLVVAYDVIDFYNAFEGVLSRGFVLPVVSVSQQRARVSVPNGNDRRSYNN